MEEDTKLDPQLIDNNVSASLARLDLFSVGDDEMPEYNKFESALDSLYRTGDQLYQILHNQQICLWARVRLQYSLVRELEHEISLNPIAHSMLPAAYITRAEKLADLLSHPLSTLSQADDIPDASQTG